MPVSHIRDLYCNIEMVIAIAISWKSLVGTLNVL